MQRHCCSKSATMTLTKYQRGDSMEGWNDCPPLMLTKNSSTSSLGSRSSKSRSYSTDRTSVDLAKNCDSQENGPGSSFSDSGVEINPDLVLEQIEQLLQQPTTLPHRELDYYGQRIRAGVPKLEPSHLNFVNDICIRAQNNNSGSLKEVQKEVVDYMILHDGVSGWCSPLKKIIGGIKHI